MVGTIKDIADIIKDIGMVAGAIGNITDAVGLTASQEANNIIKASNGTEVITSSAFNKPNTSSGVNINLNFVMSDGNTKSLPKITTNKSNGLDIRFDI